MDGFMYLKEFREAVCAWWKKHVAVGQEFGELSDGHYYRLKDCKVGKLCGNTLAMLFNTTVQRMYGSATVQWMYGSATVQWMYGNAMVQEMHDSAMVNGMSGNATVQEMSGNAMARRLGSPYGMKIHVPKGSKISIDQI